MTKLPPRTCLDVVGDLLSAGASLNDCRAGQDAERCYEQAQLKMETSPPPWKACKVLIRGVRSAGSWKAYARLPRKDVIVLRSLHNSGRAKTDDAIMKFLCQLGDNGVVWNVLSFWRARLY